MDGFNERHLRIQPTTEALYAIYGDGRSNAQRLSGEAYVIERQRECVHGRHRRTGTHKHCAGTYQKDSARKLPDNRVAPR